MKRHLRRLTTLRLPAQFHNIEACVFTKINLPASTRHIGRTTFQCKFISKFVLILVFSSSFKVICEQLINIVLILLIFRFTNIKAARVIALVFKSSMESFNGVKFLEILIGNLISIHDLEDLRLVFLINFNYFYVIL
jgi:hypothetical protein